MFLHLCCLLFNIFGGLRYGSSTATDVVKGMVKNFTTIALYNLLTVVNLNQFSSYLTSDAEAWDFISNKSNSNFHYLSVNESCDLIPLQCHQDQKLFQENLNFVSQMEIWGPLRRIQMRILHLLWHFVKFKFATWEKWRRSSFFIGVNIISNGCWTIGIL